MATDTEDKAPPTRLTGVGLLVLAVLIAGGNALLLRFTGSYFPLLLALVGPMVTVGSLGVASPRFLDALFSSVENGHPAWAVRGSLVGFIVGVGLSLYILFKAYYG